MDKEAFRKRMFELYEEAGIGIDEEKKIDADSFNYICLISSIEEEFNVVMHNSSIESFKTLGDVVSYIEENV